jgi:hypothetical protein
MSKVTKQVVICDRDSEEISDDEASLRITVTSTKKARGRKATQEIDLCESCAQDFVAFMNNEPETGED